MLCLGVRPAFPTTATETLGGVLIDNHVHPLPKRAQGALSTRAPGGHLVLFTDAK